jgi:SNF2 family DNA or RNA helicase
VEFEGLVSPRQHSPFGTPSSIRSTLKPHQCEGLDWLQKAWSFGNPGVLLADDMGLGKTLQGLAFMAWLREGMASGKIPRRPILIVAPTGLLANWLKEHDLHLRAPGLGICLEAYGAGLKPLKRQDVSGRAGLDTSRLQSADWVLTTYETLRDYIADFAAVRFAALMFDEAQKIKNPGVRMTDAAKSAQADFIIALTGTPVENQLADLWCITDTVHPAVLGDLKSFSKTYEDASDTGQTAQLRASLDSWRGSRPPLMLRRMKRDKLPDLPEEREYLRPSAMPAPQLAAYSAAITEARGADEPEAMLKVLQALRRISLHPSVDMEGNDTAFIAASARLTKAFEALDQIARSGERALIFLEERAMQARLVGILQRRYTLPQPPMLITGEVAGSKRQERVDAFQSASDGFDVMILSPKAGGVGLTLTRANHVIHLSRWWNPAVEDQCTGRAMRIGQTRPVSIHIPQATLPDGRRSFDENLDALLARKRQLSRDALMPSERPAEDTQELFRATVG